MVIRTAQEHLSAKQSKPSFIHRHAVGFVATAGAASLILALAVEAWSPSGLPHFLTVPLWVASGMGLGYLELLLAAAAAGLGTGVAHRLPDSLRRLLPWGWPFAAALFVAPLGLMLGQQMFSGAGIRRHPSAPFGPWLILFATTSAAAVAVRLYVIARKWSGPLHAMAAVAWIVVGLGLVVTGHVVIPQNYGYLWDAVALGAFMAIQGGLHLAWGHRELQRGRSAVTAALLAALVLAIIVVVRWPVSVEANKALHDGDRPTPRLASHWRRLVDFDGDGASPVLGGGDCDDFNAALHPLAIDIPGDGIDQDCDGADLSVAAAQRRIAFWSRRPWARAPRDESLRGDPPPQHTSVVLITVDALREDYAHPGTPALEALWRNSVRFRHAYAPSSSTRLSLPMMMTSRLSTTGPRPASTLATRLRQAGFRTGLVAFASPVRFLAQQKLEFHPPFDITQGFGDVDLVPDGPNPSPPPGRTAASHDAETATRALRMVEELARSPDPFFLWVHFFDPHQWEWTSAPLHPLHGGETPASRYARTVEQTLGDVSRLLASIDRAFAGRPLITLLSADHGEALGERHLRHHTRFLYDFLVRVPLLIRAPGLVAEAVETPVSLLDVMPTLLELAGLGPCGDCSGDSLTRRFGGSTPPPSRALLLRDNDQVGLILDGWKLLFAPRDGVLELYRLDDERPEAEQSQQHPDVAGEMLGLLRISPLRHFPPLWVH